MIASIGWGTYLFFAVMNALFIPIIYLFYPETAGRSLEEIDIVFAKAFVDSKSPVYVAKTMPKLSQEEIERYGVELGAAGDRPSAMEDEEEKPGARVREGRGREGSEGSGGSWKSELEADKEGEDETGGVPKGG